MQIEVLGERYQIQDPIGRGGMATIYRGRDLRTDRIVAIKILREVYSTDPKFVTRFQREAKAASSLQHPNIVQVYDYGQSEGNYFIVMECIEGTDLRRYLRSRGVLTVDRAVMIAHDIALGLGAAHRRQIVHRDVKPQNILVGRDGSIKLTDFGIASVYKDINDERLTTTGMTLGTVQYYAPEQAQGEIVNPAADVYALGIVMYEMLTGRTPFDGDTPVAVAMQHIQDPPVPPSQLKPNIPPALEAIVMRCLEKIPEMRYRDGNSLARVIELLGEGGGGGATPPSPVSGSPDAKGYSSGRDGFVGTANNRSGNTPNSAPNQRTTSSPNHLLDRQHSPATNTLSPEQGISTALGASAPNVLHADTYSPPSSQTTLPMSPQGGSYAMPPDIDSISTRPLPKGDINPQKESKNSRAINIVTILILIATLLLLGFSVYLANELGVISLPGTQPPSGTSTSQQIQVPSLIGLSYTEATQKAESLGFKIQSTANSTQGQIKQQSPNAFQNASYGSTIRVGLGMPNLVGMSVTDAENLLRNEGIQSIQVLPDPDNPNDLNKGQNTITRTDPTTGTTLQTGKTITLYVTNDTMLTPDPNSQGTSTTQPAPTPTATSTSTPTSTNTPAPTPTSTTTPAPSPTP